MVGRALDPGVRRRCDWGTGDPGDQSGRCDGPLREHEERLVRVGGADLASLRRFWIWLSPLWNRPTGGPGDLRPVKEQAHPRGLRAAADGDQESQDVMTGVDGDERGADCACGDLRRRVLLHQRAPAVRRGRGRDRTKKMMNHPDSHLAERA